MAEARVIMNMSQTEARAARAAFRYFIGAARHKLKKLEEEPTIETVAQDMPGLAPGQRKLELERLLNEWNSTRLSGVQRIGICEDLLVRMDAGGDVI